MAVWKSVLRRDVFPFHSLIAMCFVGRLLRDAHIMTRSPTPARRLSLGISRGASQLDSSHGMSQTDIFRGSTRTDTCRSMSTLDNSR